MPSSHLILWRPLLFLPPIPPSIRVFSNESTLCMRWRRRIDAFELWCWIRLLRVPWTARRSSQSILKEISPGCSLEGLMLKLKLQYFGHLRSHQIRSVAQSCPTLCDPMNCSTPGLPVHHQLPEFTQTHVHRVSDAIQPSHPVIPFSSCPQSLPPSKSFPMSQLFA